jgi:hypothetical protein
MTHAGVPLTTYRPMPADFPEMFVLLGWDTICEHYQAHKTTVKRWMLNHGEEGLRERRRAYLEAIYAARGHKVPGIKPGARAKRYVLGRTLSAVNHRTREE